MAPIAEPIRKGHYARKQLCSRSWLISWSHGRRFALGCRLAADFRGQRLLDYGCGDGTFLALLADRPTAPKIAVGAEVREGFVRDCQARLGERAGLSFVCVAELDRPGWEASFDAIVCMEVLEHVVEWGPVFDRWDRLLAPGGKVLVSVPVEIGPAVLVKEVVRRVAGWRGIGDYPGQAPYTAREMIRSVTAGASQHITRPVHRAGEGVAPSHDHKGFNWKVLRKALADRFLLRRTYRSPLPFLPAGLNSQVWFLLQKKPTPS
jgi:SAM-dependent methyltransferase